MSLNAFMVSSILKYTIYEITRQSTYTTGLFGLAVRCKFVRKCYLPITCVISKLVQKLSSEVVEHPTVNKDFKLAMGNTI